MIEIVCAAYKLYTEGERFRQTDIYEEAKNKMPKSCNRGSKQERVYLYTSKFFPFLEKELLKDDKKRNECKKFMGPYHYASKVEETMLKLFFLIEYK